jgi:hypothetical protein
MDMFTSTYKRKPSGTYGASPSKVVFDGVFETFGSSAVLAGAVLRTDNCSGCIVRNGESLISVVSISFGLLIKLLLSDCKKVPILLYAFRKDFAMF